ncbi:unnamed protein product [Pleuronectes platessa]|uniref:Adhesion G-protein coupled receptor G2 n=1 Tax=Pleuronectes platessa TaxID=8262 RepID=A0A9N7TYT9_PLEPL|nr:unnamed protein product [Pleuronectes platessa]
MIKVTQRPGNPESRSSSTEPTKLYRRSTAAKSWIFDRDLLKFGFYPGDAMLHGNEDKVKICSGGSSCCQTYAVSVRMKNPGSRVRHLHWLQILLVVLLTGHTSCNSTSTAPFPPPTLSTAAASTSASYSLHVTVDVFGPEKDESEINNWLDQVFTNQLVICGSPSPTATITTATTQTATTVKSTNTATTSQSNTAAPTLSSRPTTLSADTTQKPTRPKNPNSMKELVTLPISDGLTAARRLRRATVLFEVSCSQKKAIKNTTCTVTLHLSQAVSPCCILRTLCAASKASTDIRVVGKTADRIGPIQNGCDPLDRNRCIYNGPSNASCEVSGDAYVEDQDNSTNCRPVSERENCSCSAYCSRTDAYYTFQILIQSPEVDKLYVLTEVSKIKEPVCSPVTGFSCPWSLISSEYKDVHLFCDSTGESCKVIVSFAREVPICNVSAAVTNQFASNDQIRFDGLVTRAAICGNSNTSEDPLTSQVTWDNRSLKPDKFCNATEESINLTCQNGKNVVVDLDEKCVHMPSTTVGPNVTAMQPNTTRAVNATSSPLNTTVNATSSPLNTTVNATSSPLNTTAEPLSNITTTANVTVTTLNTTTITANVTVTTLNTTTATPNVTMTTLNTTTFTANVTVNTTLNTTTAISNVTVNTTLNTTTTTPNVTVTTTLNTTTATSNVTVNTTLNGPTTTTNLTTTESAERQATAMLELTRDVANLNSSQVDQLVSQLLDLLSGPTISLALGNSTVHIVSNLLGAPAEVLADSSSRIIEIIDTVGLKLVLNDQAETLLASAVALSVKPVDGSNFQETIFSISDPTDVLVRGDPRSRRSMRADSSIPQGSIRLPPTLTQDLTTEQQQLASRVQFNFYQKSTVFQDISLGERKLNSGILGASVANLSISGLKDNVVIHLRNNEPVPEDFKAVCVFWDFAMNNGSGGWNENGCSVLNSTDDMTTCGCNHLTSFAILLNLARQPLTDPVQATILTFITYIGCGISAIFLSITLLTYLAFGKLRKDIPSKILIQLCLSLLLLNLVFLIDAWLALYPDALGLCISTAWFLHYFLLVSFTWMGLESVHMYLALVKVFNNYVSHYMLRFSFAGWGIPMIVVIIVIAVDKDNYGLVSYGKFSDGPTDSFCWLKNDIAFYVSVVAYFCVVFLFNVVMFVVVVVQLCRIKRQNPHNMQHRTTLQDVRSLVGITILLGLSWGFAFFAWGPVNLAFMYLFAIFNSLQGFFIFVFHCAVKENVRRQWRIYLCCGKMRLAENMEWSRTATQKTRKKSSVTRLTSLQSSQSSQSNSSSSSSFLVHNTPQQTTEQARGIGSPYEDRTITAEEEPGMDVVHNEINRQYRTQQAS